MNGGPYSELEFLILAMVGNGTNSGYAMRKQMNSWRGSRWSSESGSVYRVLRRLEKDELVSEARRVGVPNRERTEYDLTAQGETVLLSWLTFPPDRAEFGYLVDPIRTRAYFLGRLKPAERIRVVKTWLSENKSLVTELERDLVDSPRDPLTDVAFTNLIYHAEARQEWLKKLLVTIRAGAKGSEEPAEAATS